MPHSKHIGPWLAFGEAWFSRHQEKLLWMLNAPGVRRIARRLLCITAEDCAPAERILGIGPNRITVACGEQLQTAFRTHSKYSKRLYFALRPLWWLMHGWDAVLPQQQWAQRLSFGFDTLTAYPDAGTGNTTVDGTVGRYESSGEDFYTIRTGAGTDESSTYDYNTLWMEAHADTDKYERISRYIATFDTSGLGSTASISSAALSLYAPAASKDNGLGAQAFEVVASTPASNNALVAADYGQLGETSFGSLAYASWADNQYNAISLNASGIAAVSKIGITKLGARLANDMSGAPVVWEAYAISAYGFYTADRSGTSQDPKLVITYTVVPIEKSGTLTTTITASLSADVDITFEKVGTLTGELSATLSADVASVSALAALRINDEERFHEVLLEGFSFTDEINGVIPSLHFRLLDEAGGTKAPVGATVELDDVSGRIFRGFICRKTPIKLTNDAIWWDIDCQGYIRNLDALMTAEAIFTDITDQELLRFLFEDLYPEVNTDDVAHVGTIPSIDLSYRTLRQCCEAIANAVQGVVWYIDADLALHYYEIGDRLAPASLSEQQDTEMLGLILRSPEPAYTVDFSAPVNRCSVANIDQETATPLSFTPPASGDDGHIAKSSANWPPEGTATATTGESTFQATRRRNPVEGEPTPWGANHYLVGYAQRQGMYYPPDGPLSWSESNGLVHRTRYPLSGYHSATGVMWFDLLDVPIQAQILSATLTVTGSIYSGSPEYDNPQIGIEFHSGSTASAYTDYPTDGASPFQPLIGFGAFPVTNPNANLNKSGQQGFSIHIKTSGTPVNQNSFSYNSAELSLTYTIGSDIYTISCSAVRFNTSSLAETGMVSGATLRLRVASKTIADSGATFGIEWYDATNWPLDAADYSATQANTAYGSVFLSSLPAVGEWLSVPVKAAEANISRTAYTGFRIHVGTLGAPTGANLVTFHSQESASPPELIVNYIPVEKVIGTAEDAASIAEFGLFEKMVMDRRVLTEDEAEWKALSEVVKGAWPVYSFSVSTRSYGYRIGQVVHVDYPSKGISQDFLIRRVRITSWSKTQAVYALDCGDFRNDLIQHMRSISLRSAGIRV